MKNTLVQIFGFPATLINWDCLVVDRWLWLDKRIPKTDKDATLLDVGCGTGAFTIGTSLKGYKSLGLSWDERNQKVAQQRTKLCKANAKFEVLDVRGLDLRKDLINNYEIVICCENIEHIINDQKLVIDMANCLKKGGRLLLTTPNYDYIPMGIGDDKIIPNPPVEDGSHVIIGYTPEDFARLCKNAGLELVEVSYCSGFFSQKITALLRLLGNVHPLFGWAFILPLRPLPLLFDKLISKIFNYPGYSICLEAIKK